MYCMHMCVDRWMDGVHGWIEKDGCERLYCICVVCMDNDTVVVCMDNDTVLICMGSDEDLLNCHHYHVQYN